MQATWTITLTPDDALYKVFRQMEYKRWCKPAPYQIHLQGYFYDRPMHNVWVDQKLRKQHRGVRTIMGRSILKSAPQT